MGGLGGDYMNKWVEAIGINQANTRVICKACNKQLGALKQIRLESSIALDSCIR
jgi:hypothetical protein